MPTSDASQIRLERVFEDHVVGRLLDGGYRRRTSADYDKVHALDMGMLTEYLSTTQPEEWTRFNTSHGPMAAERLAKQVADTCKASGSLTTLRRGIKMLPDFRFSLCGFRPTSNGTPETEARYAGNILSVVQQLAYSERNANEIDLALFVNGIPVATAELKNELTGSNRTHAEQQYRRDRRPAGEPLLMPRRGAIVHFAVDTSTVSMTTLLDNGRTSFLPFNQGREGGEGNPDAPQGGFATSYLWESVWAKDLWLELLGRFVTLMPGTKGAVVFPRWHQMRAVRRVVAHARQNGSGHNYLIQHSAGSGKSNTIAWTAIRLATLHGPDGTPVFDSVVVISDRKALDRQLQATVAAFEPTPGFVETITRDSRQLAGVLLGGARVVVSTIQKFNTANLRRVEGLGGRRFAVIVDEAHSGQSGETADALQRTLGSEAVGLEGVEAAIASRGPQQNISYLAFTATPRNVTLERFGTPGTDGLPEAFDLYPMRQAIEERFILDVLANYMPYQVLHRIEKAVQDDPRFEGQRAARAIARFVELHPHQIAQKVEVAVEHFRANVRHRLDGQAKAMVVTSSREAAVRWWLAMRAYIAEQGYDDVSALVAFSGEVEVDGQVWTEPAANGMPETAVPEALDGPGFNVLLVAEKYQTGFDQPKLVAMYVDKQLAGVNAVQTLSRLNRCYPGKDITMIVDFRNTVEEILEAFKPYYEATALRAATEPNQVYILRDRLLAIGFIDEQDVRAFAEILYGGGTDHEKRPVLEALARRSVTRFSAGRGRDEEETARLEGQREEFRQLGSSYVRFYSFVASAWRVNDPDLENLHGYMVWVNRLLPRPDGHADAEITEDMIRLVKTELRPGTAGNAGLVPGQGTKLAPISDFGAHGLNEEEELELSVLVRAFNERHGLDLKPEDAAVLVRAGEEVRDDPAMAAILRNNPRDIGEREFKDAFEERAAEGFERNRQFGTAFMQDEGFRAAIAGLVYGVVMRDLRAPPLNP